MEYISTFLANRMCKQDVIREDDRAYYAYSIQLMLEKTIGLFLICIFAFVFKAFWEIMSFLIVFALLRSHSDGFHCKTSLGCFALSVITALSTIPVSNLIRYAPGICQGGVILSMIFIFCIGTVRNPALNPSDREFDHLKKCSRTGVLIIGTIVLVFLLVFPHIVFLYYAALGIIYNALSMMIVKIKGEEVLEDGKEKL